MRLRSFKLDRKGLRPILFIRQFILLRGFRIVSCNTQNIISIKYPVPLSLGLKIWGCEIMSNLRFIAIKEDFSHSSWKERFKNQAGNLAP